MRRSADAFRAREGGEPAFETLRLVIAPQCAKSDARPMQSGGQTPLDLVDDRGAKRIGHETRPGRCARKPILRIAGEELVAALARQHDLDMLTRELREPEHGDVGWLRDRRVAVPGQTRPETFEVVGGHRDLVVDRAEMLAHSKRVVDLVVLGIPESGREGVHLLGTDELGHERDDQAAVDAPAQIGADRNVGHEISLDRCSKGLGYQSRGDVALGWPAEVSASGMDHQRSTRAEPSRVTWRR